MFKMLIVPLLISAAMFIYAAPGRSEQPAPPAIMYAPAVSEPLNLSPNNQIPAVRGRRLALVKNRNIIIPISVAMLRDGSVNRNDLNGYPPDKYITVFEFKLSEKNNVTAYLIRASIGIGGLCGAQSCPSWIYKKAANNYEKIFESDMADKIDFIDKSDYPIIKRHGGQNIRWTHTFKWNGKKYIQ
jgi:hypothetical protein